MPVIELFKKPQQEDERHISGEAKCLACQHEWVAVAPVGTWQLDCPSCGCSKGLFKNPCGPPVGALMRECNCGCSAFYVTPNGVHCWVCARTQEF